jgi:exoribonuclease II
MNVASPGTPDFKSREVEARHLDFLLEMKQLYPHAWYARRFFNKVIVSEEIGPHYGMGLDCYVQWSSPIRRFTDLQVKISFHLVLFRHICHYNSYSTVN